MVGVMRKIYIFFIVMFFISYRNVFSAPPIVGPLETQNNFSEIFDNGTQATARSNISAAASGANSDITSLTQSQSGQFYQNMGANINRLNDRVFVGDATVNLGNSGSNQDYVSQNIPQGPSTSQAQEASLSTVGGIGVEGGSLCSLGTIPSAETCLGIFGIGINDATGGNQQISEGGYFEAQQKTGAGFTIGAETDSVNQSGVTQTMNPYDIFNGNPYTVNLSLGAGGARSGISPSSAAITIVDNGTTFQDGIVFEATAINSNRLIDFPEGGALQWWGSASQGTGAISSTQTTATEGIVLTDTGIAIGNIPSPAFSGGLFVNNSANAVNYVAITPEPTGFGPIISSTGSDTNSGLVLNGKGTSGVSVQGNSSGTASPAGYVGELLTNTTTGTSLSTGTATNLTSQSLTPGVWDVQCTAQYLPAATTLMSTLIINVATSSDSLGSIGTRTFISTSFTEGVEQEFASPAVRENISTTTTAYCVGYASFTGSTLTGGAYIRATRVN
jgi:hypothetical protein